ncbi:hypothetical protein GXW74_23225 [Roseomonas eburnea]|uniref:Uncharacterized protein n=1 Tax=Neoroseomonas eburnea TaxID=1346889 RepID=A0A9X9XI81_9PROT|nr:hypothetical protein [Neoroseomonas eburnea]MBR0683417.1 hypothetical protein [Neoroseomonas eburnea]
MTAGDPTTRPDLERALLDPPAVFGTPEAVLAHPALTPEEKIEILRRWEYDAADVAVAIEEGMPGGDETLLRRITLALQQLAGPLDLDRTGPSKQHGLPRAAVTPKA